MADWNLPTLASQYTDFLSIVKDRDLDLAKGLDPAKTTPANVVTDMIRWNSAAGRHEIYNGASWGELISKYNINVDKLDGQHGSYYLAWGNLTGVPSTFTPSSHNHDDRYFTETEADGRFAAQLSVSGNNIQLKNKNGTVIGTVTAPYATSAGDASTVAGYTLNQNVRTTDSPSFAGLTIGSNGVWHSGNDGSGSGLDADKLDGQHQSYYRNASNLNAGTVSEDRLPDTLSNSKTFNGAITVNDTLTVNDRITGNDLRSKNNIWNGANGYFGNNLWYSSGWKRYEDGYAGYLKVADSNGDLVIYSSTVSNSAGSTATLHQRAKYDLSSEKWILYANDNERFSLSETTADFSAVNVLVDDGKYLAVNEIRNRSGSQLVLNAGESDEHATGQTGEKVYVNAEGGLEVNASPDNWGAGWGYRITHLLDASGAQLRGDVKIDTLEGLTYSQILIKEHLYPHDNNTWDLGNSSARWRHIRAYDFTASDDIFVSGTFYVASGDTLEVGGGEIQFLNPADTYVGNNTTGNGAAFNIESEFSVSVNQTGGTVAAFNRSDSDGTVVRYCQNGTTEGSVSVSGTSVAFNGGHIGRWSRLLDEDPLQAEDIRPGTIMSGIDKLVTWENPGYETTYWTQEDEDEGRKPKRAKVGDVKAIGRAPYSEENEKHTYTKVSDDFADVGVSGVFDAEDVSNSRGNEDEKDFYIAENGDFICLFDPDVVVMMNDLIISRGNGTGYPVDDPRDVDPRAIVGKVLSTRPAHIYPDGQYTLPILLKIA